MPEHWQYYLIVPPEWLNCAEHWFFWVKLRSGSYLLDGRKRVAYPHDQKRLFLRSNYRVPTRRGKDCFGHKDNAINCPIDKSSHFLPTTVPTKKGNGTWGDDDSPHAWT